MSRIHSYGPEALEDIAGPLDYATESAARRLVRDGHPVVNVGRSPDKTLFESGLGWASGGYHKKERRRTVETRRIAAELWFQRAQLVGLEQ